jgi:hypothetical protein
MLQVRSAVQAHAHERRFRHRLGERGEMVAEFSSVKGLGVDRPAFLGAAWMIGMIVGIVLAEVEPHLGVCLKKVDHGAGVVEKGGHTRLVEMVSRLVLDVGFRILKRVVNARTRRE